MKSQEEENRSTASKCKDKAGTRRNMLLVAMVVAVAAVIIGSELQIVAADGWGFEDESGSDESELGSVDITAPEDESGSDESLINEGESHTTTEPGSVDVTTEAESGSDESPRVTQSYRTSEPIIGGEFITEFDPRDGPLSLTPK